MVNRLRDPQLEQCLAMIRAIWPHATPEHRSALQVDLLAPFLAAGVDVDYDLAATDTPAVVVAVLAAKWPYVSQADRDKLHEQLASGFPIIRRVPPAQ